MNSNKQKVAPFTGQVASPTFPVRGQQESISFFDILWGDEPPDGVIVLWRESDRISQFFHPENKDDLVSRAQEIDLKGDVYFGIGMQKEALNENRRGKAKSVISIPGLWLDLDIKGPNHKNKNLIPSVETAEDFISRFSLRPSMIVSSGGGFHCYWIFKEPWVFENDNEWQEAVNLSSRFQQTFIVKAEKSNWKLDNTSDLARLLRIPGNNNHKGSTPIPVQIIDQNDNRYNPDDFEQFFISDQIGNPIVEINNETAPETNINQNARQNDNKGNDSDSINRQTVNGLINRCDFLKHCKDDAAVLSEPEWYKMICLLAREYGGGYKVIHELSRPYPNYTKQETDQYILKALDRSNSPITCEAIKQTWNCNRDCAVKSPIHLKQEILKELKTGDSTSIAIDSDNTDDESFNDIDLLKERIPDVPFPWSSFPPYLSASLKDLAEDMAVQPEMCGVIALGILSTAIGSMVKSVEAKKGYKSSVNLWTVIIAGTGEKKTPVFNRLMKPVHQFQKQLIDEYKKDYQVWENNQKVAQAAAQKGTQKSQKNNPEPKPSSLYTTDPTIEALIELLNDNKHGILLFQDEISGFLLSFDKYRGGKGGDREQYLSLWSSTAIKIDRVSKKLYVPDPFLSLLYQVSITLSGPRQLSWPVFSC
ncbi:MAG: DUF3987 domain-containing protein [Desulfobacula sp.]|jgi:hypothetical protein|nr:DUF3987 domain-containing protein [Desulfobacula sp.]